MKASFFVVLVLLLLGCSGKGSTTTQAQLNLSADPITYTSYTGEPYQLTSNAFLETFDGTPTAPQIWGNSADWQVTVHSREAVHWYELEPMAAQYSRTCDAPPNTHSINRYDETVYQCKDHISTAINATAYGVIYLTPAYIVDFSEEATIRFELSTARQTSRDWVDLWISPYDEQLVYPLNTWLPDLTGEPRNAIHVRLDLSENSRWYAEVVDDFETVKLTGTAKSWQGYEKFIDPSFEERQVFELKISPTHLRFGMPEHDFWWYDEEIPTQGWTSGIVQFGHHSYSPSAACDFDGSCHATTWHWDNIAIEPTTPFTIIHTESRFADEGNPSMTFERSAPKGAYLRFAGIGEEIEVSFDKGESWTKAKEQDQSQTSVDRFRSYWMPVPAGTKRVEFRSSGWWGGNWHVRDVALWQK